MQSTKIIKGYEQKLISTNAQIASMTNSMIHMESKYENLTRENHELHSQIQLKQKQIDELMQEKSNLQNDRDKLSTLLQEALKQQKILHDYCFLPRKDPTNMINEITFNFANKINEVKFNSLEVSVQELKQILNEKNMETKNLLIENKNLRKDILSLTANYQNQLVQLKKENLILKSVNSGISEIKKRIQSLKNQGNQNELQYKTTKENLQLALKMLNKFEDKIDQLQTQLLMKKQTKNKIYSHTLDVQKYLDLVEENKELKEEILNYEAMPMLMQGQKSMREMVDKVKKMKKLQEDIEKKKIKIQGLIVEKQQTNQLLEEVKQKLAICEAGKEKQVQTYRTIVKKYNKYFEGLDPKFASVQFNSIGLSEAEIKKIKSTHQKDRSVSSSDIDVKQAQTQIKKKDMQILRLRSMLSNYRIEMKKLQAIGKDHSSSLKNSENDEIKFQVVMQQYQKLQEQRNQLSLLLDDQKMKVVELMTQICELKENPETIVIDNPQLQGNQAKIEVKLVKYHGRQTNQQEINKIHKEINEAMERMKLQRQSIVNEYENQILSLRSKLHEISQQKQIQYKQKRSQSIERSDNEEMIPNHGDTMEMEDESISNHFERNSTSNLFREESVKYLTQMLNSHENGLKKILAAHDQLRRKCLFLEEKTIEQMENQQAKQKVTEQLSSLREEMDQNTKKVAEYEKDKELFQKMYEEKCQQFEQWKGQNTEEVKKLNEEISTLQGENQSLRESIEENKKLIIRTKWISGQGDS